MEKLSLNDQGLVVLFRSPPSWFTTPGSFPRTYSQWTELGVATIGSFKINVYKHNKLWPYPFLKTVLFTVLIKCTKWLSVTHLSPLSQVLQYSHITISKKYSSIFTEATFRGGTITIFFWRILLFQMFYDKYMLYLIYKYFDKAHLLVRSHTCWP